MKRFTISILLLLSALPAVALKKDPVYRDARINGALTKVELHIEDDDGMPVEKANVKAYLGMNFRPKGKWVEGTTDTNGVFVIKGKTCGDEIEVFVKKDGYYDSHVVYCYAKMGAEHEVKGGKWQPYGAEEKIVLRRIKNQMATSIDGRFVDTKRLNEWIGYDIEKHDFVAPFGSGREADFQVSIDWDGKWLPDYRGMGVRIRFVDPYSGYYSCTINSESEFKGPYNANPEAAFQKDARFYEVVSEDHKRTQRIFDKSKCWVVRSRCKVDSNGRLVKSNYSIVQNVSFSGDPDGTGSFRLTGAMNPTPNDTNLEPKRETGR